MNKIGNTKHGKSRSSEYRSWQAMMQRCNNPNDSSYAELKALTTPVLSKDGKAYKP